MVPLRFLVSCPSHPIKISALNPEKKSTITVYFFSGKNKKKDSRDMEIFRVADQQLLYTHTHTHFTTLLVSAVLCLQDLLEDNKNCVHNVWIRKGILCHWEKKHDGNDFFTCVAAVSVQEGKYVYGHMPIQKKTNTLLSLWASFQWVIIISLKKSRSIMAIRKDHRRDSLAKPIYIKYPRTQHKKKFHFADTKAHKVVWCMSI